MSMPTLPHLAISASAGSGKTFQLAHRYMRLLANGVPPERVCALTFSRKAAAEIFDSIVAYLWRAAASAEAAARTGDLIGRPGASPALFLKLLRGFLDNLPRLHIGTLDSFMIAVVRAFPAELGLTGDFRIMEGDGPAADQLRQDVLRCIFDPGASAGALQRAFFEAFKQATFGSEDKGLDRLLNSFIQENRAHYRVLPVEAAWGAPGRIWPRGAVLPGSAEAVRTAGACVLHALAGPAAEPRVAGRWRAFVEAAVAFQPGAVWSGAIDYLFGKLAAVLPALAAGAATVALERKPCVLEGPVAQAALTLFRHVLGCELAVACARTQGVCRILALFESAYAAEMRRTGRFTFEDAQNLLTDAGPSAAGVLISRQPDAPGRLYIDYRLDSSLDHWLLDEFQDTSDLQWAALSNLVDELVQDDSGTRSLFYVGDVKQAIYGWRGGNARLFAAVRARYAPRIEQAPLNASYRSCPAVIDTVNRVFGALDAVEGLPPATADSWSAIWQTHSCAGAVADLTGCVMLIEPSCPDKKKPEAEDEYATVAALLNELQPLARGLDVAILVRTNRAGSELVDVLRRNCATMPIVHEGNATIVDNPVVALLVAVMQFASHPGDTLALRHIQMSPLAASEWFRGKSESEAAHDVLDTLATHGFQTTLRMLGESLAARGVLDGFGRRRLEELLEAGAAFDATGDADADAFLRFVQAYRVRESAATHAVRVMTIHQAKGLGFDVVIVPDLMGRTIGQGDSGKVRVSRDDATQAPRWALDMPRRVVANADDVLAEEQAAADAAAGLDALCVLYVALTRARRGLYLVSRYPGKSAASLDAAALLKTVLAGDPKAVAEPQLMLAGQPTVCLYTAGDPEWYRALPLTAAPAAPPFEAAPAPGLAARDSMRRRLARLEPSLETTHRIPASSLFTPESREVLDFGTAIHALFEQVAFAEEADVEAIVGGWRDGAAVPEAVRRDVVHQFRQAMQMPAVRQALARPAGRVELWRERSFEMVLDARWVSGQFDRVLIQRDAAGHARAASILDYKSNRIPDEPAACARKVDEYRPQLDIYRRALARILDMPEQAIDCGLVFTRIGRVVWVGG